MKIEEIDIKKIKEMKYNPREIEKTDYENLKKSIKEFGSVQPLIINKDNKIIGGHQRLKALKELNHEKVSVIKLNLPNKKAKALNLALNRISGKWDYELLDKFLKDFDDEAYDLSGFTESELSRYQTKFDFKDLEKEFQGLREEVEQDYEWKARISPKDFKEVKELYNDLRKEYNLSKHYSSYANGELLLELIRNVLVRFKSLNPTGDSFEEYEKSTFKENSKILIDLIKANDTKNTSSRT